MLGASVIAVLLLIVGWALVVLGLTGIRVGVLVTLAVACAWAAFFVWRRLRARAAAREIERSLGKQADAHAQTARPDESPEIEAMQAEFQKAVRALKTSKLARGGTDALAVLPWYLIIGPPGAGKSTALRASGLKFPYLSARGGGVKGVGGTRNCEWWLTNEAVILDTAGRYATENEDRDEWLSFLDVLARTRPRKPINGLIVAVSVTDVGGDDEEKVIELAKGLRERVDEVMARLQLVLPTYLLFTKADLVPGFVEIFGDLRKNERGQIWGFTAPFAGEPGDRAELFRERFGELAACAEERMLQRLGEERQLEARERIYAFPQQLEALGPNLALLVEHLFAENRYQDTPILRGVYFTSGTQQGRTIDRVMTVMAQAFGVRPAATAPEPVLEAKSYFLRDVFSKIIFPDRNLAARSAGVEQRLRLQRYALAAGCAGVGLAAVFFPLRSFLLNRELLDSTAQMVETVASRLGPVEKGAPPLDQIEPLRARLAQLVSYSDGGLPWSMRFGMYQGRDLLPPLRKMFASAVRRSLLDPIFRQDVTEMEAFTRAKQAPGASPSLNEYAPYYDRLKLHLLLTAPHGSSEPSIGPEEQSWLGRQVAQRWTARSTAATDPVDSQRVAADTELFAKLLSVNPSLALPRHEDLVQRLRVVLQRVPVSLLALDKLVAEVEGKGYDLTLPTLLESPIPVLNSRARIPAAFTRPGYDTLKDRLEDPGTIIEFWVVDSDSNSGALQTREIQRLRSRYFERYVEVWKQFLSSISVARPAGNSQALALLRDLTSEPPPLRKLFTAVALNTRLTAEPARPGPGANLVDKARRAVEGAGSAVQVKYLSGMRDESSSSPVYVERAFAGLVDFGVPPPRAEVPAGTAAPPPVRTPLDLYLEQLAFVRDALQTATESADPGALLARIQGAREQLRRLLDSVPAGGWRPALEALLWPALDVATVTTVRGNATIANAKWCASVSQFFQRNVASRYPFRFDGDAAALADVAEFFRPNSGLLWAFYNESLRSDVQRSGDGFQFTKSLGGVSGFRPELLAFLKKALVISTVLFPSGATEPRVQLSLSIRPAKSTGGNASSSNGAWIWFEVDGQRLDFRNGPVEWHRIVWPGPGKPVGASLRVRTVDGHEETLQQDGDWGLMRLLEAGRLIGEPTGVEFAVSWSLPSVGSTVTIDFRPAHSETPFVGTQRPGAKPSLLGPFRGVSAPLNIAMAGPGCTSGGTR